MFYLLNKANDILTDPKKKENYMKYGSPDGPSAFTVGIALPSFLFNPKNQIIVLIGFALIFLGLIPYVVLKWFKSTVNVDPSGVNGENINFFYPYFQSTGLNPKECPAVFSWTIEFNDFNKVINEEEKQELEDLQGIVPKPLKTNQKFVYNFKIYILLYSHSLRIEL